MKITEKQLRQIIKEVIEAYGHGRNTGYASGEGRPFRASRPSAGMEVAPHRRIDDEGYGGYAGEDTGEEDGLPACKVCHGKGIGCEECSGSGIEGGWRS